MCEIYSNSYCTLAATASSKGEEGMFRQRPPPYTSPCRISTNWKGLVNGVYDVSLEHERVTQIPSKDISGRKATVRLRGHGPP
jgi:hypothetical protein